MNSQNIRSSSYPFSVSIQKKQSHYASGALIDSKWILTAAGDFYNVRESIKLFRARLGSVNCKKGGILVALKGVEVHPMYTYKEPQYDIALVRLAQPVAFTEHIKPIAISSAVEIASGKFYTTYWPRLIVNNQVLPASAKERLKHNSMRVSTQKLIPWKKCHRMLSNSNKSLEHSTSCLEPIVTHHSLCIPDVGAPIIADDSLWGITSGWISDTCLNHPGPTLFTRVSQENTRFWLDSITLET
ncbi:serine protease 27-like [Colias croceus]|uniref:serine protease 27-like n=1 Tax=Colias crocea TaxID=72248 RepID=UPI001E279E20|nr:serine protease 27-like [Colias croceus]